MTAVLQQVLQEAKLEAITEADLISARHLARTYAKGIGLGLVEETKLVTAVSELTRNLIVHGKGGTVYFTMIEDNFAFFGNRSRHFSMRSIAEISHRMPTEGFSVFSFTPGRALSSKRFDFVVTLSILIMSLPNVMATAPRSCKVLA